MAVSINNYKPQYSDLNISINADANQQGLVDELADIAKQVAKEKTKEGIDAFITDFLNSDRTIIIEPFDDAKWYYGLEGSTFCRDGLCISAYYHGSEEHMAMVYCGSKWKEGKRAKPGEWSTIAYTKGRWWNKVLYTTFEDYAISKARPSKDGIHKGSFSSVSKHPVYKNKTIAIRKIINGYYINDYDDL